MAPVKGDGMSVELPAASSLARSLDVLAIFPDDVANESTVELMSMQDLRRHLLFCGMKDHRREAGLQRLLMMLLSPRRSTPEEPPPRQHLGTSEDDGLAAAETMSPAEDEGHSRGRCRGRVGSMSSASAASIRRVERAAWDPSNLIAILRDAPMISIHELNAASLTTRTTSSSSSFHVLMAMRRCFDAVMAAFFTKELRGPMITTHPLLRWQSAVSVLHTRRAPLIILIGGTSGSGKSTVASLMAMRLGIDHVLSTDTIRQVVRRRLGAEEHPELHRSTYEAHLARSAAAPHTTHPSDVADEVVAAFLRQAEPIQQVLDGVVDAFIRSGTSAVVEGVHLSPDVMASLRHRLLARHVHCLPVLLHLTKPEKHRERFAVRVRSMSLNPATNHYTNHFPAIRTIQAYMVHQASLRENASVVAINNTNVDKTCMLVHEAVLELMEDLHVRGGWPMDVAAAAAIVSPSAACPTGTSMRLYLLLRRANQLKGKSAATAWATHNGGRAGRSETVPPPPTTTGSGVGRAVAIAPAAALCVHASARSRSALVMASAPTDAIAMADVGSSDVSSPTNSTIATPTFPTHLVRGGGGGAASSSSSWSSAAMPPQTRAPPPPQSGDWWAIDALRLRLAQNDGEDDAASVEEA